MKKEEEVRVMDKNARMKWKDIRGSKYQNEEMREKAKEEKNLMSGMKEAGNGKSGVEEVKDQG